MMTYVAMQGNGKAHRIVEGERSSLCGIDLTGEHILFSVDDVPELQRCLRCWRLPSGRPHRHGGGPIVRISDGHRCSSDDYEPEFPTVEGVVDLLIDTEVARAVDCYRHHMPGHGEYVLVRLGMRLARLERVVAEARDALAD